MKKTFLVFGMLTGFSACTVRKPGQGVDSTSVPAAPTDSPDGPFRTTDNDQDALLYNTAYSGYMETFGFSLSFWVARRSIVTDFEGTLGLLGHPDYVYKIQEFSHLKARLI